MHKSFTDALIECCFITVRPHRSTTYVDAAYSYRPSSVVCLSVRLSVCHTSEPCTNGSTDGDAIWVEDSGGPNEPCIRWESTSLMGRGNFEGRRGEPTVMPFGLWVMGSDWPKES